MISPPNSDKIVMWRFLRNRRLILRLHTIFSQGTHILGASRGYLCDSMASCFVMGGICPVQVGSRGLLSEGLMSVPRALPRHTHRRLVCGFRRKLSAPCNRWLFVTVRWREGGLTGTTEH